MFLVPAQLHLSVAHQTKTRKNIKHPHMIFTNFLGFDKLITETFTSVWFRANHV